MTEIIVPICHLDLLENGQLQSPADLAGHTLISYSTEPLPWAEWLPEAGLKAPIQTQQLEFEQMYFALQAAAEGLGVVLVPLFLVADDIIAGRLCAPFGLTGARKRQYFANTPATAHSNPAMTSFVEWLLREGRDTEQSIELLSNTMGWQT